MEPVTINKLRTMPGLCEPGRNDALAFLAGLPEDSPVDFGEWTQGLLLSHPRMRKYWGWAVRVGIIPAYSMAGLDLRGANLRVADLFRS